MASSRWGSLLNSVGNVVQTAAAQAVDVMAPVLHDMQEIAERGPGGRGGGGGAGGTEEYEQWLRGEEVGRTVQEGVRSGGSQLMPTDARQKEREEEEASRRRAAPSDPSKSPSTVAVTQRHEMGSRTTEATNALVAFTGDADETTRVAEKAEAEESSRGEHTPTALPTSPAGRENATCLPRSQAGHAGRGSTSSPSPVPGIDRREPPRPGAPSQPLSVATSGPLDAPHLQREVNQWRFRVEAVEGENKALVRAVQEKEDLLERTSRAWKFAAQDREDGGALAVATLVEAAEEVGALIGNRDVHEHLLQDVTRWKEAAASPLPQMPPPSAPDTASPPPATLRDRLVGPTQLLFQAIQAALDEHTGLVNGLAEIMDVRPPPRDFRVILQRLQAVLESSASHAQADVEMARRRREEAWGEEKARYLARIAAVEGECRALEEASAASVSAAHREKQRESGEDRGQSHALENTLALAEGKKGEEAAQGEKKSPSTGPGREGEAEELRRRCFQLEAELEGWKGGEPKEVTALRNETEELRRRCQMLEAESASLRARDSGSERNRTSSGHPPGSIPATTPPSRVSDGEALAQELEEARREAMEWEAAAEARALELKHVRERVMVLENEQKTAEAQQQEALRVTRATTEAELGHLRAELDRLRGRQGEGEEEEARSEERNRWTREIQRLEHALAEEKQKKTLTHAGSLSESELSKRLAEAAGKLRGKEHEMGQLRVVIEQQRELVKAKAHELERARREGEAHLRRLEAAEEMVKGLVEEKDRHLHALRAADARAQEADLEALREEVAVWKARVATMEANAVRQEEESENKVRGLLERLQAAEHAVHEQGAELAGTRADLGVLTRDFEQSETAKANLQKVLEQFQREKAAEMKHWERTHAKQLAAEAAAAETREAHLRTSFQAQIADAQAQATLSVEESERETRKALAECQQARREAASMRKALDEAIARLHSNESDVVPRQLIGNLVVSYYSQGRPTETLEIIARTLGLADEERIKVGLRALRPGGGRRAGLGEGGGAGSPGKRGLVGGLFSRVGGVMSSPRKEFVPENGTEGKTLGDLWLDYLMKETEEEVEEGEEEEEEEDGGEDQEEKEIAPPDLVSLEAPVLTSVGNEEREGKPPGMGESKALQEEEGDGTGGVIESKVHPPS